jgi:hypothetical protein
VTIKGDEVRVTGRNGVRMIFAMRIPLIKNDSDPIESRFILSKKLYFLCAPCVLCVRAFKEVTIKGDEVRATGRNGVRVIFAMRIPLIKNDSDPIESREG